MHILIEYFKDPQEYKSSSAENRRAYDRYLKLIEARFGTMPICAIDDKQACGKFKSFRGEFAATPRKADYVWTTLARVLCFAKDHSKIAVNVWGEQGSRLYDADRAEIIWQANDIKAFCEVASAELQPAMLLALWTALRQGDLLKLTRENCDGLHHPITTDQSKGRPRCPLARRLRSP